MEKTLWQIRNLILHFHNQLIEIIFQIKMTQNLKKLKTTQEVRIKREHMINKTIEARLN